MDHPDTIGITEVVARIAKLNADLASFWTDCAGWAPLTASDLLAKSRLDRQVSLSTTLLKFVGGQAAMSDGELILAWTNLGALLEGTMKTFLSVYYVEYQADAEDLKDTKAFHGKNEAVKEPEGLMIEKLRIIFDKNQLFAPGESDLAKLIQVRLNAIHAFKETSIGTEDEFRTALRVYLAMLQRIATSLPYPERRERA